MPRRSRPRFMRSASPRIRKSSGLVPRALRDCSAPARVRAWQLYRPLRNRQQPSADCRGTGELGKRGVRSTGSGPLPTLTARLPEEVVDHVNDFAGVDVDQQHVVIITDPARARIGGRQPILPRIADPVVVREEQRLQEISDREAPVAVIAIGRVMDPTLRERLTDDVLPVVCGCGASRCSSCMSVLAVPRICVRHERCGCGSRGRGRPSCVAVRQLPVAAVAVPTVSSLVVAFCPCGLRVGLPALAGRNLGDCAHLRRSLRRRGWSSRRFGCVGLHRSPLHWRSDLWTPADLRRGLRAHIAFELYRDGAVRTALALHLHPGRPRSNRCIGSRALGRNFGALGWASGIGAAIRSLGLLLYTFACRSVRWACHSARCAVARRLILAYAQQSA